MVNCIEYLQKHNIMHRDLKPLNMMLDENYNIKLIDFGDARKVDDQLDEDEIASDGQVLRKYTFVGTANYQSPEVIKEEN